MMCFWQLVYVLSFDIVNLWRYLRKDPDKLDREDIKLAFFHFKRFREVPKLFALAKFIEENYH